MINIVNDGTYFSEREQGLLPQNEETITQPFWGGFAALIEQYASNGSLAEAFPEYCNDFPFPLLLIQN